jgi:hypothetical protein
LKAVSLVAALRRKGPGRIDFSNPASWVTLTSALTGASPAFYVLQCFVRVGDPIPIGADVPAGRRQVYTINLEARIVQQITGTGTGSFLP